MLKIRKSCVRVVRATRVMHVLVDVLAFVMVLFQGGVFKYILVYSGRARGGAVVHTCTPYLCTPRKHLRAAKSKVARVVWQYQRSPTRLLSSIVK